MSPGLYWWNCGFWLGWGGQILIHSYPPAYRCLVAFPVAAVWGVLAWYAGRPR